jgi:hypothetical protein
MSINHSNELWSDDAIAESLNMHSASPSSRFEELVGDYLTVGDLLIVKGTRFSDAAIGYDITSRCACIISLGDYYMDNEGKVMGIYKLNFFIFNQDIPTESRPVAPDPMLINITIHEMEIVAD